MARQFDTNNKMFKENFSSDLKQSNKYKKFLSKSPSGQYYYASQYKPEFQETKMQMIGESNDESIFLEKYKDVEVDSNLNYTYNGKKRKITGVLIWVLNDQHF